jgi:tetratricopeptide (TPR) repeat protein
VLALGLLVSANSAAIGQTVSDEINAMWVDLDTMGQRLNLLRTTHIVPSQVEPAYFTESRLADGRMLFLLEDYVRASIVFLDLVQRTANPSGRAYEEARWYLAEALFLSRNLVAARGYFSEIAEDRSDPRNQEAAGRLLEIAFMTRHYEGLEDLYDQLRGVRRSDILPRVQYIRGKTRYFQGNFAAAVTEFQDVPREASEYIQAQYFLGVSFARLDDMPSAISAFAGILVAAPDSPNPEAGEIADMANLALGRVYYEQRAHDLALRAYQAVSRTCTQYDRALYEMTWVYMRLNAYQNALRTLEILILAVPESRFLPHAQLLRGDLLMRMSQYTDAMVIFDATVEEFGPLAEQLSSIIRRDSDPNTYFDALVDSASASLMLPSIAREWVEEDETMRRALALIGDLEFQESEVAESREIIAEINAVLNSSSRVDVFPELRSGFGEALAIQGELLSLSYRAVDAEAAVVLPNASADERSTYEALRRDRRGLGSQLEAMPQTVEEMTRAEEGVEGIIAELETSIFRAGYEVQTQRAQVAAIRLQLQDDVTTGQRTPAEARILTILIDEFAVELEALEERRDLLRLELEAARLSTGLASVAAGSQENLAGQFRGALAREIQFLAELHHAVPSNNRGLLDEIARIRRQLSDTDREVSGLVAEIYAIVDERTFDIRTQVDIEQASLTRYDRLLLEYGQQGERVAGEVAFEQFIVVQDQFNRLILRADVGIIDVAWREKEDRSGRIDMLFGERNDQLEFLDAEFREVLDE